MKGTISRLKMKKELAASAGLLWHLRFLVELHVQIVAPEDGIHLDPAGRKRAGTRVHGKLVVIEPQHRQRLANRRGKHVLLQKRPRTESTTRTKTTRTTNKISSPSKKCTKINISIFALIAGARPTRME